MARAVAARGVARPAGGASDPDAARTVGIASGPGTVCGTRTRLVDAAPPAAGSTPPGTRGAAPRTHGRQPHDATGRRRGRPRTGVLAGIALGLTSLLAACAGADDSQTSGSAVSDPAGTVVASGADCLAPQVLIALGFDPERTAVSTIHAQAPDAGSLPDDFVPVSAVLCSTGETLTDDAGRWAAVTASRLEGDVAPLVEALRSTGSDPGTATAGVATTASCAADATRSDLWLVDALGAAVRVTLPGGGCGELSDAVRSGLAALDEVDVERYPVELVEPHPTTTP